MARIQIRACIVVAGILVALAGCQKTYTIMFVNTTDQDMAVTIDGPGKIWPSPPEAPLARRGGRSEFKVTVDTATLPMEITWQADDYRGAIPIQKDSNESLPISVP
jgi:hypothetical protein